eukprot:Sro1806_g298910.2  (723) ;mRNA; r:17242-19818
MTAWILPLRITILTVVVALVDSQSEDVFRLFYRFGFKDGRIGDPGGAPSQNDVEGLMCATNEFLSDSIQNYTKNGNIQIFTTEIDWGFEDWIYNGSEPEAPRNVPVIVNFTTVVTTSDGSPAPTNDDLWQATKHFDYFSYIMNYLWTIPGQNFFSSARGLWYEPFIQPAVTGQIPQSSQCPGTPIPADSSSRNTPVPTVETTTGTPSAASSTAAPSAGQTPYPTPEEPKQTPAPTTTQQPSSKGSRATAAPSAVQTTATPSAVQTTAAPSAGETDQTPGPTMLPQTLNPTQGQLTTSPTKQTQEPTMVPQTPNPTQAPLTPAPTISTPPPTRVPQTPNPTQSNRSSIDTSPTKQTQEPTMVPQTPNPTQAPLTPAPTISPSTNKGPSDTNPTEAPLTPSPTKQTQEPTEVPQTPNPTQAPLTPAPTISTPPPTRVPQTPNPTQAPLTPSPTKQTPEPTMVPQTPNPTQAPLTPAPTISTPAPTATPQTPNPTETPLTPSPTATPEADTETPTMRQQQQMTGEPSRKTTPYPTVLVGVTPDPTPTPTDPPVERPEPPGRPDDKRTVAPTKADEELVYFNIQMGFFDGQGREPQEDEIEAMICQTNIWFENSLRDMAKDSGVNSFATNIDWEYEPSENLPLTIWFTSHSTDGSGNILPAAEVYDYILHEADAKSLITNFIWNSEPYTANVFYNTENILFGGSHNGAKSGRRIVPGKLPKAMCPS